MKRKARRNHSTISGTDIACFMFGLAALVGVVAGTVIQYL